MDKNVLENVYLAFVHTRYGMRAEHLPLYHILQAALAQGWRNTGLMSRLRAAECRTSVFVEENGSPVDTSGYGAEMALVRQCVDDITAALELGRFEMVDDLANALHFVPLLIANQEVLHADVYTQTHLRPLNRKWGLAYTLCPE